MASGAAALRKSVPRRAHKERSQPSDRRKHGLLEKHKDYVLRARDFHRKEKTLQVLEERATFRNEDEFYFGMQGQATKGGVEQARASQANKYSQDVKYVTMRATIDRKRAERLRGNLHGVDQAGR